MAPFAALLLPLLLTPKAWTQDVGSPVTFPNAPASVIEDAASGNAIVFDTGEGFAEETEWDGVFLQGEALSQELSFEASRRLANGDWSPWVAVETRRYEGGRFWGTAVLPPGDRALRIRATGATGTIGPQIVLYGVEVFSTTAAEEPELQPARAPRRTGRRDDSSERPSSSRGRPEIVSRSRWNARESRGRTPHSPYRVTIHHTESARTATLSASLREAKIIQDYHMGVKKWNDIGYHFLIDEAGNIIEGVPEDAVGTHTARNNPGNIGISFMGNFTSSPPSARALRSLKDLLRYLGRRYDVAKDQLKGHKDYKSTTCPGNPLHRMLPELRVAMRTTGPGRLREPLRRRDEEEERPPSRRPRWDDEEPQD